MPLFYYKDPLGKETEVIPEALSRYPKGFVHCMTKDDKFVTIHKDHLIMKFTPEEISQQQKKQHELSLARLRSTHPSS